MNCPRLAWGKLEGYAPKNQKLLANISHKISDTSNLYSLMWVFIRICDWPSNQQLSRTHREAHTHTHTWIVNPQSAVSQSYYINLIKWPTSVANFGALVTDFLRVNICARILWNWCRRRNFPAWSTRTTGEGGTCLASDYPRLTGFLSDDWIRD